jgi:hypothetical protein
MTFFIVQETPFNQNISARTAQTDSGDQPASFPACAFFDPQRYYTPVYTQRGRGMEEEYFFNQSTLPFRAGKRTPLPGGTAFSGQVQAQCASRKQCGDYHTQYRLNGHEQVFSCHVLLPFPLIYALKSQTS